MNTRLSIAFKLPNSAGFQIEFITIDLSVQYSNDVSPNSTRYIEINDLWYNREIEIIKTANG